MISVMPKDDFFKSGRPSWWRRTLLLLGMSVLLVARADNLPNLGDVSASDLSPQAERRIGESVMRDIRLREPTYLDDPEVEYYLNDIGGRLASHAEDVGGSYRFFAINDNSINAFAMFGGFIGVNTGLIMAAQTESEFASVLAHEVSHVSQRHLARQVAKEKDATVASMLAIALAIVAARSNADAIGATIMASQAGAIQAQLSFTRDFEREADRVGFDLLDRAGFDPHGMVRFFERLQKATRVYENNAPVYMRTHPVTLERISDMENRADRMPFKQVRDSLDFHLVRAKILAQQGTPQEAVKQLKSSLDERKFPHEGAARYGYAIALQRAGQFAEAEAALGEARKVGAKSFESPMLDRLGAQLRVEAGDAKGGVLRYEAALLNYSSSSALRYGYAEALLVAGESERARRFLADMTSQYPSDPRLLSMLAKTYLALGRLAGQHRALAELYVLNGQLAAAVEQLNFAQRVRGNDFYEQSAIEARLRELKALLAEETARQQRAK